MKAVIDGQVIAESSDMVEVGGYQYFPQSDVRMEWLRKTPRTTSDHECPHSVQFYDVVIDGVDNFPAKFLINDACFFAGKPLVHGGILRFDGRVTTIIPGKSACYRCIFKAPPPPGLVASCQEAGVIGVLAGIIGTIQATEALKLVLGIGRPLTDRLLDFDARKTQFREIKVRRNPKCALCGEHPTITELFDDGDPYAGCALRPSA